MKSKTATEEKTHIFGLRGHTKNTTIQFPVPPKKKNPQKLYSMKKYHLARYW
jgi:hypothetical protein